MGKCRQGAAKEPYLEQVLAATKPFAGGQLCADCMIDVLQHAIAGLIIGNYARSEEPELHADLALRQRRLVQMMRDERPVPRLQ